jgi:hypothetical protein
LHLLEAGDPSSNVNLDYGREFRSGMPCVGDPEIQQDLSFFLTLVSGDSSIFASEPFIDPVGTLQFEVSFGRSGESIWMIQLKDDGHANNTSPPRLVKIVVLPVNQAPSFTLAKVLSVYHNTGTHAYPYVATDISAGPYEQEQRLTFTVSVESGGLAFLSTPAITEEGTLIVSLREDITLQAVLVVKLYDDGGTENGGHDVSSEQRLMLSIIKTPSPVRNLTAVQVRFCLYLTSCLYLTYIEIANL